MRKVIIKRNSIKIEESRTTHIGVTHERQEEAGVLWLLVDDVKRQKGEQKHIIL